MTETQTPRHQPPKYKPVVCAHRGFKAKYPENTLLAFNAAISDAAVGCKIIETDIHISHDGVIVINHDADTGRCYNERYTIATTDYDPVLKNLKNKEPPHESILTLTRALKWLMKKNQEIGLVKFMLDIKAVNKVTILDSIIEALIEVEPNLEYWHDKIIFGLWNTSFYEHGVNQGLINGFEIFNITTNLVTAREMLALSEKYKHVISNFNAEINGVSLMHIATWGGSLDDDFIKFYEYCINKLNKRLFLWTCNDVTDLGPFYCKLGVSGFLTDHPDQFKTLIEETEVRPQDSNLYDFYAHNDPINFHSTQGLKNFATYKVFKAFTYAARKGYMQKKVPIIYGGKYPASYYSISLMRYLGMI